jgi:hypothetical protein
MLSCEEEEEEEGSSLAAWLRQRSCHVFILRAVPLTGIYIFLMHTPSQRCEQKEYKMQ